MKPHEERVVEEYNTLQEKLEKLYDFFDTETFSELPEKSRTRLEHQAHHMLCYLDILSARITDFEDE